MYHELVQYMYEFTLQLEHQWNWNPNITSGCNAIARNYLWVGFRTITDENSILRWTIEPLSKILRKKKEEK